MDVESIGGLYGAVSNFSATGAPIGKLFALYGAGFSFGKNIIRVMRGKNSWAVTIADVIRDTIIAFLIGSMIGGMGGESVSESLDSLKATFSKAFGTTVDPASLISGLLYSMGISFGAVEIFTLTAPPIIFGVLAGMIFGFFFS